MIMWVYVCVCVCALQPDTEVGLVPNSSQTTSQQLPISPSSRLNILKHIWHCLVNNNGDIEVRNFKMVDSYGCFPSAGSARYSQAIRRRMPESRVRDAHAQCEPGRPSRWMTTGGAALLMVQLVKALLGPCDTAQVLLSTRIFHFQHCITFYSDSKLNLHTAAPGR